MKILQTIMLLLFLGSAFGQKKISSGIFSSNSDTSFWYKYQMEVRNELSLPRLDTTSNREFYRIWTNKQVIDIWQNQSGGFFGKLTTWTNEYVPNKENPTYRTFINTSLLSTDTAKLIRELFLLSNMVSLPTDDSIKGWQNGFDGITYIIEHSTSVKYSFKTYWTPKAQGSLNEAKQVQGFIDSAFALSNSQKVWNDFAIIIPYECYINGGPGVACKVLTRQQRKKYIKERKNYRQHGIGKSGLLAPKGI